MASRDQIKTELSELATQGQTILKQLLDEKSQANFHFDYQAWFTKALRAVQSLAPDRYEEFRRYYEPDPKRKSLGYGTYVIQDYLKNVVPSRLHHPDFDSRTQAAQAMFNQLAILGSVSSRIDSVLANVEAHLLADLQDAELATARVLLTVSPRAAGALAGVVLEAYLQKVALEHQVKVAKKAPTNIGRHRLDEGLPRSASSKSRSTCFHHPTSGGRGAVV